MRRTDSTDTARCVARALRHDRSAVEELVRAESPRLHGIAWRIVGDASLAEDVVQEVFVRILERRSPLRRQGAARSWLTRVTAHTAIDLVRRNAARARREEVHAMVGTEPRGQACDAVADAEVHALVAEGFATLPVDARAAIWLTVVEGGSFRRTADAVGLPIATTHRRVREGLESLRTFLRRRGATSIVALPMANVLRGIPAPPPPQGLAARVLERTATSLARDGVATAAEARIGRRGRFPAATEVNGKLAANVAVGLFLILGVVAILLDPFDLRDRVGEERPVGPAAVSARTGADDAPVRARPAGPPPEAERPVDPLGSILARVVYADDRTPVPEVLAVGFTPDGTEHRRVATDGNGEARLEQVPAGEVRVYLQMGSRTFPATSVHVREGTESEVTLEAPPGLEIDGIVVDGNEAPVPGASIWLTERHNSFRGAAVAVAGADGAFRLQHVELKRFIGARAPGFAPSMLRSVDGRPAGVLPIRIVLDVPGVAIEGVVVGPDGELLPDAMVKIEKQAGGLLWTPDGDEVVHPPLSVRTDADGGFALDGVPVGDLTIAARWGDLVPYEGPITVPAAGLRQVRVRLEAGVTISGTVLTPQGEFAVGTLIAVGSGESSDPYRTGDLSSVATTVGHDGTYRLVGVAPGEVAVRADRGEKGSASATFIARAGEEIRWDARLASGLEIHGRVVDERGSPLGKVLVGAEGEGCIHSRSWTDPEGRFRFANCQQVAHSVAVYLGELRVLAERHEDIVPGSGAVTLVVRPEARPSAFLSGKVVDPTGRPAGTARIVMTGLSTIYTEADGSFRVGPLPPGPRRFDVLLDAHPRVRRACELAVNEITDVGTIAVRRGGRVEARLRNPDGTPCRCRVRILNDAADLDVPSTCSSEGIVSSELAQPGGYFLLVWRPGLAATWIPLEIEEGQTAVADVTVYSGIERDFRLASLAEPRGLARVTIREAGGPKVFDCPLWPDTGWTSSSGAPGFCRDFQVSLAPGKPYIADVRLDDRSASASFFVSGAGEGAGPILLDLR